MEQVFRDLATRSIFAWAGIAIALLAGADLAFHMHAWRYELPLLILTLWVGLTMFLSNCVYRAAMAGPGRLLTVCVWSCVIVVLGIVCGFAAYFSWPDKAIGSDRILTVIPVLVAVWAAGLGWFVHYQLSSKAHRSKNSFDVLMQMRMNSEFRRNADLVGAHFPPGTTIPEPYVPYFPHTSLRDLEAKRRTGVEVAEEEFERVRAILALKYVLNHFEFVAAGIKKGDLDEKLLYDTISTTIIGTFRRAKRYVDFINGDKADGGQGEVLAFCHMKELTKKWDMKLDEDIALQKRHPA